MQINTSSFKFNLALLTLFYSQAVWVAVGVRGHNNSSDDDYGITRMHYPDENGVPRKEPADDKDWGLGNDKPYLRGIRFELYTRLVKYVLIELQIHCKFRINFPAQI